MAVTHRVLTLESPDHGAVVDYLSEHVAVEVIIQDGKLTVEWKVTHTDEDGDLLDGWSYGGVQVDLASARNPDEDTVEEMF